ncbi:unnamed protein product [Ixodes persulcatus]
MSSCSERSFITWEHVVHAAHTWKRRITVLVQAFLSHAVVDQFNSLSKMQYLMTGKCHNVDSLLQFCYE